VIGVDGRKPIPGHRLLGLVAFQKASLARLASDVYGVRLFPGLVSHSGLTNTVTFHFCTRVSQRRRSEGVGATLLCRSDYLGLPFVLELLVVSRMLTC